jgi:pimeloyl-ACP methyl ester carboxylesterase
LVKDYNKSIGYHHNKRFPYKNNNFYGGTMRTNICLLLLLICVLCGCQPTTPIVSITNTATTFPTPKPTDTRLSLEPCTVANGTIKAECGHLHVPEDRNAPNSRVLDLGIIRVPAQEANKAPDPLFFIAGGPGGVATDPFNVQSVTNQFAEIYKNRDIIFLDQRGINEKHRLTCEYQSISIADASQEAVNNWMTQCLSNLNGDPRFYTTAEAMRDLDEARVALGYDKINLYGLSYGAAAVQVYIRMFPEHVRAAVLDHGASLDTPYYLNLPGAFQSALNQIFTYCEQDEKCRAAFPDILGDWNTILNRLSKGPVTTSYTPAGSTTAEVWDTTMLVTTIYNLMFLSGTYIKIPFMIHSFATNQDWTEIVRNYEEQYGNARPDTELLVMFNMIFCFEPAWGGQLDDIAKLNLDPNILDIVINLVKTQQKICAALPKPEPSSIYGPGKPLPISVLMLNSLIDPQFPPSSMDLALKEFTKSRVVVEPTEGHDPSYSACRWSIIAQYIQQGSVDGLDISCMEKQKPFFATGG